jgi:hypothetical protein
MKHLLSLLLIGASSALLAHPGHGEAADLHGHASDLFGLVLVLALAFWAWHQRRR